MTNDSIQRIHFKTSGFNWTLLVRVYTEFLTMLALDARTQAKKSSQLWFNALRKAMTMIVAGVSFHFDYSDGVMVVESQSNPNVLYGVTAHPSMQCECMAFKHGRPCKHRALRQLLIRYVEAAAKENKLL